MEVIVPLAGSDLVLSDGRTKCLIDYKGEPLTKYILQSRPWHDHVSYYHFVFQDNYMIRELYDKYIVNWFPNSTANFLGGNTNGAALSTLTGVTMVKDQNDPLIVDLADIFFLVNEEFDTTKFSTGLYNNGAFTFESNEKIYSYLKFDHFKKFVEAKEKTVISNIASAGVYFFENSAIFLSSLSWYLGQKQYTYNGVYYVCPMLNGVKAQGGIVNSLPVTNVDDVKEINKL